MGLAEAEVLQVMLLGMHQICGLYRGRLILMQLCKKTCIYVSNKLMLTCFRNMFF